MIKAIIFDLGGVLLDIDMHQCFENIKALGIDMDVLSKPTDSEGEAVGSSICEGITASGMMHLYQEGKVSTEDFIGTMVKLSRPGTTCQQANDAWNSCLLTIPQYKLDFIKELRSEGYPTYLLSNTNEAHWNHIVKNNFPEPTSEYFDHCFLSQEVGLAKPDPRIYEAVLAQIPYPAHECLFLDDSKANCLAAEALGINCINVPTRTDYRDEVRQVLKTHQS